MKIISLGALMLLSFYSGNTQSRNFIDQPYIEVSGNADTLVNPDRIYIRIFLTEKDSRDRIPVEELEQRMVDVFKSLGINTEKDLAVADMTSNFRVYLLKSKDVLKSKLYMLKVKDAITASQVFIKLEEIDISNINIDRIEHSEMEDIRNMMRSNAMNDARKRAVALTKTLNQSVGPAIYISDIETTNQDLQNRVNGIRIRGSSLKEKSYNELPMIEFEKIKISAVINAKFILK